MVRIVSAALVCSAAANNDGNNLKGICAQIAKEKMWELNYQESCNKIQADGKKCLPGMEFYGAGINIFSDKVTVDALGSASKESFLNRNIAENTQLNEGYAYQDGARVTKNNAAFSSSAEKSFDSFDEFQRSREASLNIEGTYGMASGSAALKGGDSVKNSLKKNKKMTEKRVNVPLYTIANTKFDEMNDICSVLDDAVNIASGSSYGNVVKKFNEIVDVKNNAWKGDAAVLKGLLTDKQKSEARHLYADKWFERWGTHMISNVVMGGELVWTTTSSACATEQETKMYVDTQVCAGGTSGVAKVDGCAGFAQDDAVLKSESLSSATCTLQVRGGDTSKCGSGDCNTSPCDVEAWKASLTPENAAPISFELSDVMKFHGFLKAHPVGRMIYELVGGWEAVGESFKAEFKTKMEAQVSTGGGDIALDKSSCKGSTDQDDSNSVSTRVSLPLLAVLLLSWLGIY